MSKVANIHTGSYYNYISRALGHLGFHNRCYNCALHHPKGRIAQLELPHT